MNGKQNEMQMHGLEQCSDIRRIPFRISHKFERHGPVRCYTNQSEHAVRRSKDGVHGDVIRGGGRFVDGVIMGMRRWAKWVKYVRQTSSL